jgi:hypothetical protein
MLIFFINFTNKSKFCSFFLNQPNFFTFRQFSPSKILIFKPGATKNIKIANFHGKPLLPGVVYAHLAPTTMNLVAIDARFPHF